MRLTGFLVLVCTLACPAWAAGIETRTVQKIAGDFVTLLADQKFDEALEYYDETMTSALPAHALRTTWNNLLVQAGVYLEQVAVRTERIQVYDAVFVTCQFEKALIDVRVVLDRDRKVAGLFMHPGRPPEETKVAEASYSRPEGIRELDVVVGEDPWKLPGTLTLPRGDGPFNAVVLVHGSGPHDRDESMGPNKPFRDIAWGLADRGVAVLRYEKRSLEHGKTMAPMTEITVRDETIDDALAAAALLRGTETIRPEGVYVIGHSLGGMLAPRMGLTDPDIAGLVILAGTTRALDVVILEQLNYLAKLDGEVTETETKGIDEVAEVFVQVRALDPADPKPGYFLGAPATYWLDLRDYRPHEAAKQLEQRLLILQGERDYQVTMEDFAGWKEALSSRDDVTLKSYPGLNHLFMMGEGPAGPGDYEKPGHVSDQVLDDIAAWIGSE